VYKKGNKMTEIWKNNDLRQVNEMSISKIILVFARGCSCISLLFFVLNSLSYYVYCYFSFVYVGLPFKLILQTR